MEIHTINIFRTYPAVITGVGVDKRLPALWGSVSPVEDDEDRLMLSLGPDRRFFKLR